MSETESQASESDNSVPLEPGAETPSNADTSESVNAGKPMSVAPEEDDPKSQEATLEQAFERLNRAEKVIRKIWRSQIKHFEDVALEKVTSEGMLFNQIAELETRFQQSIRAMQAQNQELVTRMDAVERVCAAAEKRSAALEVHAERARAQQNACLQAWKAASLTVRLKFVRELLPENSALQIALKEMEALEDLRRRGRDLENWILNYPSLFADAVQALYSGENGERETHSAYELAVETLEQARATLETNLHALGVTWITPTPGEAITGEHQVLGEEPSPLGADNIARVCRRGFRFQGKLLLPAQVFRAVAPAMRKAVAPTTAPGEKAPKPEEEQSAARTLSDAPRATVPPSSSSIQRVREEDVTSAIQGHREPGPQDRDATEQNSASNLATQFKDRPIATPDWLRTLLQRSFGCALPAFCTLVDQLAALVDLPEQLANAAGGEEMSALLLRAVQPLVPLLGMRYAGGLPDIPQEWGVIVFDIREPLLVWLHAEIGLEVFSPARGSRFDPETMESVEIRRTAHAHEENTIAKLERIGLLWEKHPLLRAQVVRYASGENA